MGNPPNTRIINVDPRIKIINRYKESKILSENDVLSSLLYWSTSSKNGLNVVEYKPKPSFTFHF